MSEVGADGPSQGPEPTRPTLEIPEVAARAPKGMRRLAATSVALTALLAACAGGARDGGGPTTQDSLRNPAGVNAQANPGELTKVEMRQTTQSPEERKKLNDLLTGISSGIASRITEVAKNPNSVVSRTNYKVGNENYQTMVVELETPDNNDKQGNKYNLSFEARVLDLDGSPDYSTTNDVVILKSGKDGSNPESLSLSRANENWFIAVGTPLPEQRTKGSLSYYTTDESAGPQEQFLTTEVATRLTQNGTALVNSAIS